LHNEKDAAERFNHYFASVNLQETSLQLLRVLAALQLKYPTTCVKVVTPVQN